MAKQNNRSVNAEIVARLKNSLAESGIVGAGSRDLAGQAAMAVSLADVAVVVLTQDESWKSDVARRVAEILRAAPELPAGQVRKSGPRAKKA